MKRNLPISGLKTTAVYCLLTLFALNVVSVLAMVFLVGFGKMILSESLILMMIGWTVTQATWLTRIVFPILLEQSVARDARSCGIAD